MKELSNFQAFVQCKCPRCRQGNMFANPPFSPKFNKMYEDCPVCGLHYEIETGFYWGSMYVNYASSVALVLPITVLIYFLMNDPEVWVYISIITAVLLLSLPFVFRYGRVIMLYVFGSIKYNKDFIGVLK